MDILLICVVCIVTAILAKSVQPTNRDIAAAISITAVIVAFAYAVDSLYQIFSEMRTVVGMVNASAGYIETAFKALGICIICELSSSCCRDCGETALGGVIDVSGRIAVSVLCIPLIGKFLEVVKSILEL